MDENYVDIIIDRDLKRYLNIMGAILLTSPKQCGKTTTAMHMQTVF